MLKLLRLTRVGTKVCGISYNLYLVVGAVLQKLFDVANPNQCERVRLRVADDSRGRDCFNLVPRFFVCKYIFTNDYRKFHVRGLGQATDVLIRNATKRSHLISSLSCTLQLYSSIRFVLRT